jgi:polyisoprenyl-teichoic acid--peptidoglycan teichoic acid transferase
MADGEKPYRLYKGGRAKGRVPLQRHEAKPADAAKAAARDEAGRKRQWGRWIAGAVVGLLLLTIGWGVAGYVSVARAMQDANDRVPASVAPQLTKQDGLLISKPSTILVLGTDGGTQKGRAGSRRTDSIVLIHTDPSRRKLAYLSIPRDLRVDIPGHGTEKINAAFQYGGPTLALKTVRALTGIPIDHVVFADFDGLRDLVDAVGGIEVDVPKPILANKFDCPYKNQAQCDRWKGWRFEKGPQHMNGRRALVYSRIRVNRLDFSETDVARQKRQQQVIQATADKLTSLGGFVRMPFIGGDVVKPIATDLSAWQLAQLGWVWFRADEGRALHCRLGGEPGSVNGESVILGSEDNVSAIAMFTGRAAPLPPPKGLPYAPGCTIGG